jgi:hypothetical protein
MIIHALIPIPSLQGEGIKTDLKVPLHDGEGFRVRAEAGKSNLKIAEISYFYCGAE